MPKKIAMHQPARRPCKPKKNRFLGCGEGLGDELFIGELWKPPSAGVALS
ncbi:MAG TPA: hypothetical protein VN851_04840 [Thermoanaerobaculia bacterium]|nr:hypothetical protein [Thermoanaerobaculia bacterium]